MQAVLPQVIKLNKGKRRNRKRILANKEERQIRVRVKGQKVKVSQPKWS